MPKKPITRDWAAGDDFYILHELARKGRYKWVLDGLKTIYEYRDPGQRTLTSIIDAFLTGYVLETFMNTPGAADEDERARKLMIQYSTNRSKQKFPELFKTQIGAIDLDDPEMEPKPSADIDSLLKTIDSEAELRPKLRRQRRPTTPILPIDNSKWKEMQNGGAADATETLSESSDDDEDNRELGEKQKRKTHN